MARLPIINPRCKIPLTGNITKLRSLVKYTKKQKLSGRKNIAIYMLIQDITNKQSVIHTYYQPDELHNKYAFMLDRLI